MKNKIVEQKMKQKLWEYLLNKLACPFASRANIYLPTQTIFIEAFIQYLWSSIMFRIWLLTYLSQARTKCHSGLFSVSCSLWACWLNNCLLQSLDFKFVIISATSLTLAAVTPPPWRHSQYVKLQIVKHEFMTSSF